MIKGQVSTFDIKLVCLIHMRKAWGMKCKEWSVRCKAWGIIFNTLLFTLYTLRFTLNALLFTAFLKAKGLGLPEPRQSQAISNLTKIKNPNIKIQISNEIQMLKCQNIKSVSSEIVREWNSQISFLSHSLLTPSLFTNFVIWILGLIWHLSFVICHF